jgi:signal transduction histidine kinase
VTGPPGVTPQRDDASRAADYAHPVSVVITPFVWLGRALAGLIVALGRGLAWTGRGLAAAGRMSVRVFQWLIGPRGDQEDEARRRRRGRMGRALVWITALICAAIGFGSSSTVYDVARTGYGPMPFVGALAGLPIALIATRPLLGLMISVSSAFVLTETLPPAGHLVWPWLVIHGLVMMALLAVTCAREKLSRALGAWLITASLFFWGVQPQFRAGWIVGITAVALFGVLAGRLVTTRSELSRQEEETAAEKAQRVVLEERARIARDLHDIVAHHMSLVVVQAETASYRVPGLSDQAQREFTSIGEAARSALSETRALLSVLRAENEEAATAPQPGLAELDDLVDSARRAGVDVSASITSDLALRPSDSLAVYRIAQEALANASRHAAGAPVRLTLERVAGRGDDGSVRLAVVNGPVPVASVLGPGHEAGPDAGGHGITGMRERASAAGGRLVLGPAEDGGFRVELLLPEKDGV